MEEGANFEEHFEYLVPGSVGELPEPLVEQFVYYERQAEPEKKK